MIVNANPVPYKPMTLDTTKATLATHAAETIDGKIIGRADDTEQRLGMGKVQRRQSVSGHARSDADLREGRLRSEAALSGGIHIARMPTCSESASPHSATSRRSSDTRQKDEEGTANPVGGQING